MRGRCGYGASRSRRRVWNHDGMTWTHDDADQSATSQDVLAGAALAAGITLVAFLVLQVLVVAVALGTSNFDKGEPGPAGGLGFGILTAAALALATGAGALLGGRWVRLRHGSPQQALVGGVAGAGGLIALLVVVDVLVGSPRASAVVLAVVAAAAGSFLGARRGAQADEL